MSLDPRYIYHWFHAYDVACHARALDCGPAPLAPSDMTSLDIAILSAVSVAIKRDLRDRLPRPGGYASGLEAVSYVIAMNRRHSPVDGKPLPVHMMPWAAGFDHMTHEDRAIAHAVHCAVCGALDRRGKMLDT